MTPNPADLAARPAFAQFLNALRGGEEFCRCYPSRVGGEAPDPGCPGCSGSGRVAVPPDPEAGLILADWWQEQGGDLAGMLWCYAFPPPREARYLNTTKTEDPEYDDSLRPAVVALTGRDDDPRVRARTAAARGLRVIRQHERDSWWLTDGTSGLLTPRETEPAARLALKRAVLALYDPLVRVPCRAEGARLTVRTGASVTGAEWEIGLQDYEFGRPWTPQDPAAVYRLDGVRLGAPPDWSWTPHALPGGRLAVTWECRPSDLLPAAGPQATVRVNGGPPVPVREWHVGPMPEGWDEAGQTPRSDVEITAEFRPPRRGRRRRP